MWRFHVIESEERTTLPRCRLRAMICLASLVFVAWLLRCLTDYLFIVPGKYGFEWTERYGSVLECNETTFLLTRMRFLGHGKYVPVLRSSTESVARIMWNHTFVGFNPTLICVNGSVFVVGSANREWSIAGDTPEETPIIYMAPPHDAQIRIPLQVPLDSCIERFFATCSLDSKLSIVHANGTLYMFARANLSPSGGARHVQMSRSADDGKTWSNFSLLSFEDYEVAPHNNIYIFEVSWHRQCFVAHFPAVFEAANATVSGIFASRSLDGRHWSRPQLLMRTAHYGARTTVHPLGGSLTMAMRINLHFHTEEVEIVRMDEKMSHVGLFDTKVMV